MGVVPSVRSPSHACSQQIPPTCTQFRFPIARTWNHERTADQKCSIRLPWSCHIGGDISSCRDDRCNVANVRVYIQFPARQEVYKSHRLICVVDETRIATYTCYLSLRRLRCTLAAPALTDWMVTFTPGEFFNEHILMTRCLQFYGVLGIGGGHLQDQSKCGTVSKVQWANGLKLVLQLDVPFLSYVVSILPQRSRLFV